MNLKEISAKIKADIDAYCVKAYDGGHRDHLGASIIGEDCLRKSYYSFRWVKKPEFDGRMHRLFQTGHREEARYIEYLRGIGFQVWDRDENGEQFKISGANGHYGGSLDGIGRAPDDYGIEEPFLLEFKTKGTGRGFTGISEKGVRLAESRHYKQMSQYGKHYGFHFALYITKNKNDDDIICEFVELDWNLGEEMERRAVDIVNAETPPAKIALSESFFDCKFCQFNEICFHGVVPEKNCRSCQFSKPVENKQWFCKKWSAIIPDHVIKDGCDKWTPVE